MLAGGTGITPMLQISDAIFREGSGDTTKISLLFANQSEEYGGVLLFPPTSFQSSIHTQCIIIMQKSIRQLLILFRLH